MDDLNKTFNQQAEKVAFDKEHRRKINFNIGKYDAAVVNGLKQFKNLELARKRAALIKHRSIENLDKYLSEFEINFEQNGGKVQIGRASCRERV